MLENLIREMRSNACAPSELTIPKIRQHTPTDMFGTTRSRISFFLKKFRKLDFMDDNRELHAHSSFLIVKHKMFLLPMILPQRQRQVATGIIFIT